MSATATVESFFDAYRAHDVERMVDLCDLNADFSYVPFEAWGRQRVVRGDGKVCTIGKTFWTTLIDCFPDLTNEVTWTTEDDGGNVAVEVVIGGTQAKDFKTIPGKGQSIALSGVAVYEMDGDLVREDHSYWDNATLLAAAGVLE